MKTLIKLIVAALFVNAAYHCGSVALKYYQFKDETQQMILFGQAETVGELTRQILGEAAKRDVPLDEEDLTVTREGARTVAEVSYTENVEVFPRYFYPLDLSFSAEAYGVPGASGAARPRPRK
jgi:type III secretion system FlhB-like substrate exporter